MNHDDNKLDPDRVKRVFSAGHSRPHKEMLYGGPLDWRGFSSDPYFAKHLIPTGQIKVGDLFDVTAINGSFDGRIVTESVEPNTGRVTFRTLYMYESAPVPKEETASGGLKVEWRGKEMLWSIRLADVEDDAVVRSGFATERLAADHLAGMVGKKAKRGEKREGA